MHASIAETVLQQLGGRRFTTMTGARNFVGHPDGLAFKLPSRFARDGINHVRVILCADDTYSLEFFRVRGVSVVSVAAESGVYSDMLQERFKAVTGLDTHL